MNDRMSEQPHSRRDKPGSAHHRRSGSSHQTPTEFDADIVLIGGGIMSVTLGSMLAVLDPGLRILILERAGELATESTGAWNNAGTGHSGYCELNYMPDPGDGATPAAIARQFELTRQWWGHLAEHGLVDPDRFIHPVPHVNVVFGRRDVDYLRTRYDTLRTDPLFAGMAYSEDPATIRHWVPLVMEGRGLAEPIAATRQAAGTDVDFGALTAELARIITDASGTIRYGHHVRTLRRGEDGGWLISGRNRQAGTTFCFRARRVFVGAGGMALRLLQAAKLPQVKGYAVLSVGAAFYRTDNAELSARHNAKVYSQADVGAPPMSVPHLDRRRVNGRDYLMFGPYATFSTRLLKSGRLSDFFTTLRPDNVHVIAAAGLQNLDLVRYLVGQLMARPRKKFAHLSRFFPNARPADWTLLAAGQRAQLVKPDRKRIGVLQQGTELVSSDDGTVAGLLGASPGASTAVPIMLDMLQRCFPREWAESGWRDRLAVAIPGMAVTEWTAQRVREAHATTDTQLQLGQSALG